MCKVILIVFILKIVIIKLIDFKIDEVFVKCKLKIVKFIEGFEWVKILFNGGYIVYLVLVLFLINVEEVNNKKEGGNN